MDQNFGRLPLDEVMSAYRNAAAADTSTSPRGGGGRVFLLDHEGTLAPDRRRLHREYGAPAEDQLHELQSKGSPPDEEVLECLRTLCQDPRNTVVVLSGRSKQQLEGWFDGVPGLGLAAEHGFYYRVSQITGDEQWHC